MNESQDAGAAVSAVSHYSTLASISIAHQLHTPLPGQWFAGLSIVNVLKVQPPTLLPLSAERTQSQQHTHKEAYIQPYVYAHERPYKQNRTHDYARTILGRDPTLSEFDQRTRPEIQLPTLDCLLLLLLLLLLLPPHPRHETTTVYARARACVCIARERVIVPALSICKQ